LATQSFHCFRVCMVLSESLFTDHHLSRRCRSSDT
jgi:hypothetical protein